MNMDKATAWSRINKFVDEREEKKASDAASEKDKVTPSILPTPPNWPANRKVPEPTPPVKLNIPLLAAFGKGEEKKAAQKWMKTHTGRSKPQSHHYPRSYVSMKMAKCKTFDDIYTQLDKFAGEELERADFSEVENVHKNDERRQYETPAIAETARHMVKSIAYGHGPRWPQEPEGDIPIWERKPYGSEEK